MGNLGAFALAGCDVTCNSAFIAMTQVSNDELSRLQDGRWTEGFKPSERVALNPSALVRGLKPSPSLKPKPEVWNEFDGAAAHLNQFSDPVVTRGPLLRGGLFSFPPFLRAPLSR